MTNRHTRGGVQTTVDPRDDPERSSHGLSGTTGPRHQSPAGGGRHGNGPGRQPFGPQLGTDLDDAGAADTGRPSTIARPSTIERPIDTAQPASPLRAPFAETPPLGSGTTRVSGASGPSSVTVPPSTSTTTRAATSGHRSPETTTPSRRWPWLLLAAGALVVGVLLGRASAPATPAAAAAPPQSPVTVTAPAAPPAAPPAPSKVALPSVAGRNGAIVAEQLKQLGFEKVQLASKDDDDKVVVDPADWTASKIEPSAGSKVATDSTIVVTLTKKN